MIELFPKNVLEGVETLDLRLDAPVPELKDVLNNSAIVGGKKLRPVITFLMGNFLGVPVKDLSPYARVSELLHTATLAHDDVIDEALERRGTPTLNALSGNAKAVLAGDFLLAKVVYELSQLGNLGIVRDVAQVLEDMSSGEWMQIDRRRSVDVTVESLEEAARKKTASLMAWCCRVPAWLAGGSSVLLATCKRFGQELGLAFQMVDDLLDFEEGTGKPYAQDFKEGLINFVSLELINQNSSLKVSVLDYWKNKSTDSYPWTDQELEKAKSKVRQRLMVVTDQAKATIQEISAWSMSSHQEREKMILAFESLIQLIVERKK